MILRELIEKLGAMDPAARIRPAFGGRPHSWRGSYDQVAFDPVDEATVAEMLATARSAVGVTLHGWKGGEFGCDLNTECNVAFDGDYGGDSDRMSVWWAANIETSLLRSRLQAAEAALLAEANESRALLSATVDRAEAAERDRDDALSNRLPDDVPGGKRRSNGAPWTATQCANYWGQRCVAAEAEAKRCRTALGRWAPLAVGAVETLAQHGLMAREEAERIAADARAALAAKGDDR